MNFIALDWHILLFTGLLFAISQVGGKLAQIIKSPRLVGYLISGIIFGPSVLGLFSEEIINQDFAVFTKMALGVIAFSIGSSIQLGHLARLKKTIVVMTLFQGICSASFVGLAFYWLLPWFVDPFQVEGLNAPYLIMALLVGAAAAATAPAAIISLIHEYKAKGEFKDVLLGIVALDDALTLVLFALAGGMAQSLINEGKTDVLLMFGDPLLAILLALVIGSLMGVLCLKVINWLDHPQLLGILFGAVLITSGLAETFGVSYLLANMMFGFILSNFSYHRSAEKAQNIVEEIEGPLFGIFFLLAGAHLNLGQMMQGAGLAAILIITRSAGKYFGSAAGAWMTGAPIAVRKYIGLSLLPATGVMIGLLLDIRETLPDAYQDLVSLIISSAIGAVIFYALVSPFVLKYTIRQAARQK